MRIVRLADLLATKYKYAMSAVDLESAIRKQIPMLWKYPTRLFPILQDCASAGISGAKTPEERKAFAGYKFCKELLSVLEYIHMNWLNISMPELKEKLMHAVSLINDNKNLDFTPSGNPTKNPENLGEKSLVSVQFPHVSELIHAIFPVNRKYDRKAREEAQNKARTGLSRILSLSLSMLEELSKLELMAPEDFATQSEPASEEEPGLPRRFDPQRAQLSVYDIVDFIRQHGAEYGIDTTEDWGKVFLDDPILKQEMTTVINAINRGHAPLDGHNVKVEIDDILRRHKERAAKSNAHLFEDAE